MAGSPSRGQFLDAVYESYSANHLGQQRTAVQSSPSYLGGQGRLEHDCQTGHVAGAVFGPTMPQPNRRERALDRIRRPQMSPVLGGEVVERQQHLAVLGWMLLRNLLNQNSPAHSAEEAHFRTGDILAKQEHDAIGFVPSSCVIAKKRARAIRPTTPAEIRFHRCSRTRRFA